MATERLQERQLALLGPAGHGLGGYVQDVGRLGGPEVAAGFGCVLPARWAATAHPFRAGGLRRCAGAWTEPVFVRHDSRPCAAPMLTATLPGARRAGQ